VVAYQRPKRPPGPGTQGGHTIVYEFRALFTPIQVGRLTLKNRI
jgi:hypothetical protein